MEKRDYEYKQDDIVKCDEASLSKAITSKQKA